MVDALLFAAAPAVGRFLPGKAGDALAGRGVEHLLAPGPGAAVFIAWTLAFVAAASRARRPQRCLAPRRATSPAGASATSSAGEGNAATALVDKFKGADMLEVGSRGLGGFRGLLLGSVMQQCAQHAHRPVVIVPAEERS